MPQDQHRLTVAFRDPALARGPADAPGVGRMDEDVLHLAALVDALGVDGQPAGELGEVALLDQAGRQVGAHAKQLRPHDAEGEGLDEDVYEQREHGDDHRQPDRRRDRPPPAHPAGEADDELVLGLQPVERQQRAGEHRDRQDQRHQLGIPSSVTSITTHGLWPRSTIRSRKAQAVAEQAHHRERGGRAEHGIGDLPKKISLDKAHLRVEKETEDVAAPDRAGHLIHGSFRRSQPRPAPAWRSAQALYHPEFSVACKSSSSGRRRPRRGSPFSWRRGRACRRPPRGSTPGWAAPSSGCSASGGSRARRARPRRWPRLRAWRRRSWSSSAWAKARRPTLRSKRPRATLIRR